MLVGSFTQSGTDTMIAAALLDKFGGDSTFNARNGLLRRFATRHQRDADGRWMKKIHATSRDDVYVRTTIGNLFDAAKWQNSVILDSILFVKSIIGH